MVTKTNARDKRRWQFVKKLRHILPREAVLFDTEDTRPYECDGLSAYREQPWVVALPDTVEQVQAVMRLCRAEHIPVIARGAGTGLSGGALPGTQSLLLSLAKFSRILDIDPVARTACVQPGVRNLAISEAVKPYGLYYAPDPSSQIACTIGGNVAENSGGVHGLKYGLTVHNIRQLKIITLDGELVTIGGGGLDGPGYDLLALLHGSEGQLGIIAEVTVKLLPRPEHSRLVLAAFDDIEKAANAAGDIIARGIIPAALEMMDRYAVQAAEAFAHAGYPENAEAILLCELDGVEEEVSAQTLSVRTLLKERGAGEVRCASDATERELIWRGRKAVFPAIGRLTPDCHCLDGTIPRQRLAGVLKRINELSNEYNLTVANVIHAGDGNLHPMILYDANKPGEAERRAGLSTKILELCIEAGGTITGEHGVGVEKLDQMCVQFKPLELQQFHAVKQAFDADGLLNPGKAVPTLHRCAERGYKHMHHDKPPHPKPEHF